ncbi:MAG: hypothetical protein KGI75_08060 [Rhizobiaceae bacterium]|nr:hypothetical protein [Rhizobiaceae bacterium]
MKMQTKPFVVEHKVSRRSERKQSASIWGGVDIAVLAQEVAEDLPRDHDDQEKSERATS